MVRFSLREIRRGLLIAGMFVGAALAFKGNDKIPRNLFAGVLTLQVRKGK